MKIAILAGIAFILLLAWATSSIVKQSNRDWDTFEYLKKKADTISTKEEIEEFHKEFLEKAKKIDNPVIRPHLHRIDGYLRGLYKQYVK